MTEQEILDRNVRVANEEIQAEISRISTAGFDAATDADKAFMQARRSYLTAAQKEAFGITDDEPKAKKSKE